jgi:molecular chaperone DnaJ
MPRDYYDILQVPKSASSEDIKKAFRRLGKQYHPDVSTASDAHERFQELNEAYQVLSDPDKRRAYDQFGHAGVNMGAGGTGGYADFNEIFEEFMGAFMGRGARTGSAGANSKRRPRQGRDLRYDLNLSFEQAIFGDDVEIEVTRHETCTECGGNGAEPGTHPISCMECAGTGQVRHARQTFLGSMVTVTDCTRCGGTGQVIPTPCKACRGKGKVRQTRVLSVNIPAGVDDGTQIRLSGEGEPGEYGGPAGNLYVVLAVKEHPYFKRRGSDILLEMNVNVAQAALGATLTVPTVEGEDRIQLEAGTQTGTIVRLKNKGFPKLRPDGKHSGRGDQLCIINVVVPTRLTPEQRDLFERLSQSLGAEGVQSNTGGNKGIFDRMMNWFNGA